MLKSLVRALESGRGGAEGNLRTLEGWRGLAVLLVFFVHYASLAEPHTQPAAALRSLDTAMLTVGNAGVDLFFVLSGYLIYGSLIARRVRYGHFLVRRVERIYPTFLAVFALYLVLSITVPSQSKLPAGTLEAAGYVLKNLLLLPGIWPEPPMISVAWSLSYEMAYYLAMPLVVAGLGFAAHGLRWRLGWVAVMALALATLALLSGHHDRLLFFLAGVVVWELAARPSVRTPSGTQAALGLGIGLLLTGLPLEGTWEGLVRILVLCAAYGVALLTCVRDDGAWTSRALSWSPLRWLGNISYSYYLIHGLVLKAAFIALWKLWPGWQLDLADFVFLIPVMLGITLVPALALYLAVELPLSIRPRPAAAPEPRPRPAP